LAKNKRLVELKDITKRTLDQNAYLHVIISFLAIKVGYSADEVKRLFFKDAANKDLFKGVKSSASLGIEDMSTAIERFKIWAAQNADTFLPDSDNKDALRQIQSEISKNKHYL
jgi:isocitrate dehydrogenase kinase/phosphatase